MTNKEIKITKFPLIGQPYSAKTIKQGRIGGEALNLSNRLENIRAGIVNGCGKKVGTLKIAGDMLSIAMAIIGHELATPREKEFVNKLMSDNKEYESGYVMRVLRRMRLNIIKRDKYRRDRYW